MSIIMRIIEHSHCWLLALAIAVLAHFTLGSAHAGLLYHDSFDYPATPATQKLAGNTNAEYGKTWTLATLSNGVESPNNFNMMAGSLTADGFSEPAAGSNSVNVLRGTGGIGLNAIVRVDIPGEPITSGSVFFSMLIKASTWANLTYAQSTTAPNLVHTGVGNGTAASPAGFAYQLKTLRYTDPSITGNQPQQYHLGVIKNGASGEQGAPRAWDMSQTFGVNETVFVVGEYRFNSASTTDDEARLWINPTPRDTSGYNSPDVVSPVGMNDVNPPAIRSFYFAANTFTPGNFQVDELRIGNTFASVLNVPEPASISYLVLGLLCGGIRRRAGR
jgi:hypothetical protein